MDKLISKILKKELSLKSTILSLFSFILTILIIVLSSQLLYFSKKISIESVDLQLNGLVQNIQTTIKNNENVNINIVDMLSLMNEKDHFNLYINILKSHPHLYSVYTGYNDGSFYEIINLNIHKNLKDTYKTKDTDRWLLIKISAQTPNKRELLLFDEDLNLTSSRVEENNYDPRNRPWYESAILNENTIKTPPYTYSHINNVGITYAKDVDKSKNVVAIDVLTDDFATLYKKHINKDFVNVVIFQENGLVLSSSNKDNSLFEKFFEKNKNINDYKELKVVDINKKEYITKIVQLDTLNKQEYIVIFADYEKITEPYLAQTFKLLLTFIIIAFLMFPIMIYLSGIIIKPIYNLVKQSIKIKNRKYNDVSQIESPILEIALLSASFENMAQSINGYQNSLEEKVKQRTEELLVKNAELLRLSITDNLTKLYNRVKLDKSLQEEMNRSLRYNTNFSIILLDIDYFKKVNDNFGHQVGDEVLIESAQVLSKNIRNVDILGRWGGEEFLVICPETKIEDAIKVASHINAAIKLHKFTTYPNTVTMSLGVASFNKDIKNVDNIILNADKALYQAKEEGRDRVIAFYE
ncbi:sensor domain-containing diguanylate cyclase [Aliarcobacter butzleri]|uniref:sensor domain-containing diguanylate cyclase n=1 Tax=Aliarcobacter butzleri TaxID=28197 RepID=UPI001EDFA942|nr:diguanylate cyclase [Aliarcobacter butzleri]MCG3697719.1 diguanylate cyclase [Aliarcobacter butzleri]MCG3699274.1 diguanylate cyclase [Aliarcobacter butzleri]MCT7549630.1 diguanylate cyclase [Aliarcobacter butzleri]MCT7558731.1 diguanylate cyclase [Aliarcobacter butzleri]MDN5080273.1 diguanylate cyclase [Aliarcobacter butzleri]